MDADERRLLEGFLDGYRSVLLRKAAGLDRQQLSLTITPSTLSLGGLLKHMALVEDIWFTEALAGEPKPAPWNAVDWESDRDWELTSAADDEPEALRSLFAAAVERSRAVADRYDDLAAVAERRSPEGHPTTLRWIHVHMIEEYARHCGHADLLREAIDGTTGD